MVRFYLLGGPRGLRIRCALALTLVAGMAHAQSSDDLAPPPLGVTLTADALGNLPAGDSLYTLLDTTVPEIITDRLNTGGMYSGSAWRIGARGSSWTQTMFRLDGVDITAGDGSGAPLLLPDVLTWERVNVYTGLMPIDVNAPGLAISLAPRRPGSTWTRLVEGLATGPALVAGTEGSTPPSIARLNSAVRGRVLLSGPLVPDRAGIVVSGAIDTSKRFERADPTELSGSMASLFTHIVYTATPRDEVRVIGWAQRNAAPVEQRLVFGQPLAQQNDGAAHAQVVWERRDPAGRLWSTFGAFSVRERDPDLAPTSAIVEERVFDGPPDALINVGSSTDRSWSAGVRMNPSTAATRNRAQTFTAGAEILGQSLSVKPEFTGRIGEVVNGTPARVWDYSASPTAGSTWSGLTLAAYASDRIQVHPRIRLAGGIRFERVTGSAAEGSGEIAWNDLLPRGDFRFEITRVGHISALASYARSAHRLVLSDLAWGDPSAPFGSVYRWNAAAPHAPSTSELGPLVARVGPGAGPTSGFTSIDPDLARPHMDEFTFGFEGRPTPQMVFRLVGMGRLERNVIGVVDTGVPTSAYQVLPLPDAGLNGQGQVLQLFNRPTSTFGLDRYSLTNPVDVQNTFVGAELTGEVQTAKLFLMFGLTAGRAEGYAANRGFRATENDYAVLGDVYIDPNSRTLAQGRDFTERGYTIKLSSIYKFDHDVTFGFAARYQDGQHFARLIFVPNVNQGPELVRAFRNGRTRFTFTGTLDARLQKGFTIDGRRVALLLEGYNIFNMDLEVEEYQVTVPLTRPVSAVQPPRAILAGFRLEF